MKYQSCRKIKNRSPLCRACIKETDWVWNTLKNFSSYGLKIGEESITDFVVLGLKKFSDNSYIVHSFTRRQEYVTGADWEIWVTGTSKKWVGLRIQAKVISLDTERFDQLHYRRRDGTSQLRQLLEDAKKVNAVPLYCLYTYWNSQNIKGMKRVCLGCNCKFYSKLFGMSVLLPRCVQWFQHKNDDSLKNLASFLIPFPCVFCNQNLIYNQKCDLPMQVYSFLISVGVNECLIAEDKKVLLEVPPCYVKQILSGDIKEDLNIDDNHLQRITIIEEN